MTAQDQNGAAKFDWVIACHCPGASPRTALLLTADKGTTLGGIIQLLVEYWDLLVWDSQKHQPIGYELQSTNKQLVDISLPLDMLSLPPHAQLRLVPVTDDLVVTQQSTDLLVFDVHLPSQKAMLTVLLTAESMTAVELQDCLEDTWNLPLVIDGDPVYYELRHADGHTLQDSELISESSLAEGESLTFVCQPGVKLIEVIPGVTEKVEEIVILPSEEVPGEPVESATAEEFEGVGTGPKPQDSQAATTGWEYWDFDLQIAPARDTYTAQVLSSPAGEAAGSFEPPDRRDVKVFILQVGRTRRGVRSVNSPSWKAARDFGKDLFERLFRGEVLGRWTASLQAAQTHQRGLRLKLRLDNAPDLMSIPWEFLYYPAQHNFLAPQEGRPIVRFLGGGEPRLPMHINPPLRILAMAASPTDLERLDTEDEKDKLNKALGPLVADKRVLIDWVDGGNINALHQHLLKSAAQYHAFHFIGHGGFDEDSQEGFLAMEGADGRYQAITGERIAPLLLVGQRHFRLAVLNSCEGARTSLSDPFASVATSLVSTCGLPACVAMQFEITDQAAITFGANFYQALATGRPVDTAVTSARLAIWLTHNDIEWGTPVLYMRAPDGRLFDFGTAF